MDTIDGQAIGKVNFVLRDSKDRIWLTISTKIKNWMNALRTDLKDGYVARYEDGKFRIIAEGFGFTNEIRFDAREEFLYVVETTGGCITRLRIDENGNVAAREVFGPVPSGKGSLAGRHRLRHQRQPLGNHGVFGQTLRADARGRSSDSAGRRRP